MMETSAFLFLKSNIAFSEGIYKKLRKDYFPSMLLATRIRTLLKWAKIKASSRAKRPRSIEGQTSRTRLISNMGLTKTLRKGSSWSSRHQGAKRASRKCTWSTTRITSRRLSSPSTSKSHERISSFGTCSLYIVGITAKWRILRQNLMWERSDSLFLMRTGKEAVSSKYPSREGSNRMKNCLYRWLLPPN